MTNWIQNVEGALHGYYGQRSLQVAQFMEIEFFPGYFVAGQPESYFEKSFREGVETAKHFLQSRISELEEEAQNETSQLPEPVSSDPKSHRKVFVVHGHDHGTKETVARFLTKLELEPIILHEKPNQGRTIIEKFEANADVACAVVILSPDDVASSKSAPAVQEERARQNVIFELGYFVGRLGRRKTFALVLDLVTKPSDFDGVLYIPMNSDSWKMQLLGELKAAGMDVDANKAF